MAEPITDSDERDGCDGIEPVSVDVPASVEHIAGGCDVPAECSSEEDTDPSETPEQGIRDWVESIDPSEFATPITEEFFMRWEALGMPELDSDTLYEFSGTPEETHAAARALDRWELPPKPDTTPRLSAFTDLVLA